MLSVALHMASIPPGGTRSASARWLYGAAAATMGATPRGLLSGLMPRPRSDISEMSDGDLVRACASRDASAWRELVHRYRRLVYAIPLSFDLQSADADDVFQQTFAELLHYVGRMRQPDRVEAWLVTTARRASLRLIRERRRSLRLDPEAAGRAGESPAADARIERVREGERLRRLVESLGEPCRTILTGLFADPPKPYRTIARQLGLAVGSLGSLRSRCLTRLRRQMGTGTVAERIEEGDLS